jgi:ubiquinone/menaquinone biosynthesis C-methylase UbiE
LATNDYASLWASPLASAQGALLGALALRSGERVLDVACGTGLVTFRAARSVGAEGHVPGTDLSGGMVAAAGARAAAEGVANVSFERMDAEALPLPDAGFDLALRALGLMYMPDPERALREMRRVLRRGGRRLRRLGRAGNVRLGASVRDRRCGSGERRVPVVLSSRGGRERPR